MTTSETGKVYGNSSETRSLTTGGIAVGYAIMVRVMLSLLCLYVLGVGQCLGAQESSNNYPDYPIDVYYIEYPPYYYTENGEEKGILVEKTKAIFAAAGIDSEYILMPSKRALEYVARQPHACSIGWFKNPEREKRFAYSRPIYSNTSQSVVYLKKNATLFSAFTSLESLLASELFTMGAVNGHSEGAYVDRLLERYHNRVNRSPMRDEQLVQMLSAGRFDFILYPPEEIGVVLRAAGLDCADFESLVVNDIPSGNLRYIICNKNMPESVLERINAAIFDVDSVWSCEIPALGDDPPVP